MKKLLCFTDPVIFSLFGGAILGTGMGSLITLISFPPLPNRWIFNIIGFLLLFFSGLGFNFLSISLTNLKIMVESAPESVLKKTKKDALIDSYYVSQKQSLNTKFWLSLILMIGGIIFILLGPIYLQYCI